MAKVKIRLPRWDQCDDKRRRDTMNRLEEFIHKNEPADARTAQVWRDNLANVLAEAIEEDRRARA